MEEDEQITVIKEEVCSDNQTSDVVGLEVLPTTDPLEFDTCQGSTFKGRVDSMGMSCEPENQHLDTICLNIRIAIIRCFYSSSNCPATALQKLKEEDNELCVTVNVEDVNFFVQKFEKTGSVIGNLMDSSSLETDDIVNTHSIVETVFDDPAENNGESVDKNNQGMDNFSHSVFLETDGASQDSQRNQATKRKRKAPLARNRKKDQSTHVSQESKKRSQSKAGLQRGTLSKQQLIKRSQKDRIIQNQTGKEIETNKKPQSSPTVSKRQCKICMKQCPSRPTFHFHFLSHFNTVLPKTEPFKCPGCHNNYANYSCLIKHLFHRCSFEQCDFFKNPPNSTLLASSSDASREDNCHSQEEEYSSFQDHMEQIDNKANENKSSSAQKSLKKQNICSLCSKILPDVHSLGYHIIEHYDLGNLDEESPYKCPQCDGQFKEKRYLYKHVALTCHKRLRRGKTPFVCHLCSKAFQFEIQLEHHLLVHSGKANPRECHHCGKKFNTVSGFRYHLTTTHAEKKAHQCDLCPRYFKSLKVLEEHKMAHSGTYLYVCKICGKNCDNSASFRSHMTRHVEAERWQCEICGKDFSGKYRFKKHMRTHTGEVEAVCDLCGKGFTQSSNLKIHKKTCQKNILGINQESVSKKKEQIGSSSSGAANLHSCDAEEADSHGRDSQSVNIHGHNSGDMNLQSIASSSSAMNFQCFGAEALNLHGLASGDVNIPGFGSSSAGPQKNPFWFKYNQQWP